MRQKLSLALWITATDVQFTNTTNKTNKWWGDNSIFITAKLEEPRNSVRSSVHFAVNPTSDLHLCENRQCLIFKHMAD